MQLVRSVLAVGLSVFLFGCGESDVCSSGRTAASRIKAESAVLTDYCIYKKSLTKPGPPLGMLAQPLGKQGKAAVMLWVEDMETGDGLYKNWEYGPILSYVRDYTGYRICSDKEMLQRAKAGLLTYYRRFSDDSVRSMIAPYC